MIGFLQFTHSMVASFRLGCHRLTEVSFGGWVGTLGTFLSLCYILPYLVYNVKFWWNIRDNQSIQFLRVYC